MPELQSVAPHHLNWGYIIYRTIYSAESDTLFPEAIRYIEASIKRDFLSDNCWPNTTAEEIRQTCAKYQSTIIEDPILFSNASFDTIRAHFENWVKSQGLRDSWT